jgi:Tol biopolymer transport system component
MIGTKLAHYEITAHLGSGGMGDVYQATDTKLNRSVAIKFLPAAFASDAERLLRFGREAQMLAALNHPNIAQIYGIEETGDTRCIVMELVQGETLQERIKRGPVPLDEALTIAKEIAIALEAAHDKGVIHRDLKPGNVMLTGDGKIKVLDFGLAKAYDANSSNPNLSNSPTMMSMAATNMGVILGTAAYMSPEQAKGRAVDRRTDIFALGCILYEMLTGKPTFDGADVTDILGAVLRIEPDWTQLPASTPSDVRDLLRLYLEKNPKNRRSDATDVRLDIDRVLKTPATSSEKPIEVVVKTPRWKLGVLVVTALLIGAAIAGAAIWKLQPMQAPTAVTRFAVPLPDGQVFTNTGRMVVTISPDGSQIVYVANQRLFHRAMSELEARAIPGTENFAATLNPVFSPDGKSIVFWATSDQTLKKIAVTGGASVTLCPADAVVGMTWGEHGIIYGQGAKGIFRVSENGGTPELLVSVEKNEFAQGAQLLPDGQSLLYTVTTDIAQWEKGKIFVRSLQPGSVPKLLIDGGADARYVSTGHIVYAYLGNLFAVPFDLKRLQVTGGQVPILEGVRRGVGAAQYGFSDTASLIYVPGPVEVGGGVQRTLAIADRRGNLERKKLPPRAYSFPRLSPDRKHVAVSTDDKESNVWIIDLASDTAPRQLTLGGVNRYPVWSADSQRVAFQSDREGDLGIFWQKADGTGTAERLTKPEQGTAHIPDSFSADGKSLAYSVIKGPDAGVWIFSVQDKKSTVFAEKVSTFIGRAAFSPDGQWLAYQSTEAGTRTTQIFVQPFPPTGAKYPVVRGGHPFWSPDGKELIYNPAAGQIGAISITTKPTFAFGEPVSLPGGTGGLQSKNPMTDPRLWDFAPDGKQLIGVADANTSPASTGGLQIQVVLNWLSDLKQRVPVK